MLTLGPSPSPHLHGGHATNSAGRGTNDGGNGEAGKRREGQPQYPTPHARGDPGKDAHDDQPRHQGALSPPVAAAKVNQKRTGERHDEQEEYETGDSQEGQERRAGDVGSECIGHGAAGAGQTERGGHSPHEVPAVTGIHRAPPGTVPVDEGNHRGVHRLHTGEGEDDLCGHVATDAWQAVDHDRDVLVKIERHRISAGEGVGIDRDMSGRDLGVGLRCRDTEEAENEGDQHEPDGDPEGELRERRDRRVLVAQGQEVTGRELLPCARFGRVAGTARMIWSLIG